MSHEEGPLEITQADAPAPASRLAIGLGRWGPYELLEVLGSGGMGTVYRAIDRRLGRELAIKFIGRGPDNSAHGSASLAVLRFQREARAQARIDHEGVCKVYEVGELEGHPYIAMQLVRGTPLNQLEPKLGTEEKAAIVRDVAIAVQAAHRLGIVHRDLKPSNVLVDRSEDGRWHPVVLDFGLARDAARESDLSETGSVLGTPAYMAPEAARGTGGPLDRRSDVYSLGAVLYTLLAGRPPYVGESPVDVLLSVLEGEPPALRSLVPSLSPDLEWIVMRCLERDASRRYDSARAFAEDLQRFLDGEPVRTLAASSRARLRRWIRRHRLAVTAALFVGLVLAVGGGYTAWIRMTAARQMDYAQHLSRDLEEMSGLLRRIRDMPLHDINAERERVRVRIRAREAEIPSLPAVLRGPALSAVGRSYLLLGDLAEARAAVETAWNSGYRVRTTRLALGQILAEQFRAELAQLTGIGDAARRKEERDRLEDRLLKPALALFDEDDGPGQGATIERARLALYRGRYAEAIQLAGQAFQEAPWEPEALAIQADAHLDRGIGEKDRGEYPSATEDFQAAEALWAQAIERSRSDERFRIGEARLRAEWWELARNTNAVTPAFRGRAMEAGDQLLAVTPRDVAALDAAARLALREATYLSWERQDPRAAAEKTLALLERVGPDRQPTARLLDFVGAAYIGVANYQGQVGGDPGPPIELAIRMLTRATRIEPMLGWPWQDLAIAMVYRAKWAMTRGQSGRPDLERQITASEDALRHQALPRSIAANRIEGAAYGIRDAIENGGDPALFLEDGERTLAGLDPADARFILVVANRAWFELARAEYARIKGVDPFPSLASARESLARTKEELSDVAEIRLLEAGIHTLSAELAADGGRDVMPALSAAMTTLKDEDRQFPQGITLLCRMALVKARAGAGDVRRRALDEALELAERAVAVGADHLPPRELLATVLTARVEAGVGDVREERARALELVGGVLAGNPRRPRALELRQRLDDSIPPVGARGRPQRPGRARSIEKTVAGQRPAAQLPAGDRPGAATSLR